MAERTFDAVLDQLDDVLAFVDEQLDLIDCPMKSRMQVLVTVKLLSSLSISLRLKKALTIIQKILTMTCLSLL